MRGSDNIHLPAVGHLSYRGSNAYTRWNDAPGPLDGPGIVSFAGALCAFAEVCVRGIRATMVQVKREAERHRQLEFDRETHLRVPS